jgi:hypothetical protein
MQYPAGLKKARKRKNKNGTDPDDLLDEETADIPEYSESEASDKDAPHEAEVTATSTVRPQKRTYRIKGREYVRAEDVITNAKPIARKSMVWKDGRGFEIIDIKSKVSYYYCRQCHEVEKKDCTLYVAKKGTTPILEHWREAHGVDAAGNAIQKGDIAERLTKQKNKNILSELIWSIDFEFFKMLLIRWIVYCHLAFFMFENMYFLAVVHYLNSKIAALIPGRKKIRAWIMEEFSRRKRLLRREFRKARSNIHLSFDLWSSPNCMAVIAINAHWIDSTGRRRTTLLALKEIIGSHSGEAQAAVILRVIKDYKIGKRVGFFMLDNATSNDTAVDIILSKLYPNMTPKQRLRRRLRCLGHVVNLAAQTFILGKDAEKTLTDLELLELVGNFTEIEKTWRKNGVLGKLHNLVKYIRMTPQRRQEFAKCQVDDEDLVQFNCLEVCGNCAVTSDVSQSYIVRHLRHLRIYG